MDGDGKGVPKGDTKEAEQTLPIGGADRWGGN